MKISKNSKGIGWEKENNISIDEVDLTSYAKKTDLPTKTSELTNDSGFTTSNDVDKMIYENLNEAEDMIKNKSNGSIFAIVNFDYVNPFNELMKEE